MRDVKLVPCLPHRARLKALVWALCLGSGGLSLPRRARAAPLGDGVKWEQLRDEAGIHVFRWQPPGSDLFAFKANGLVEASLTRIASVLIDVPRRKEWMPNLIEGRVVRMISPRERIEYMALHTPPFTKNRDFVMYEKLEFDRAHNTLILHFTSVQDAGAPETPMIRGRVLDSTYTLHQLGTGDSTAVECTVQVDPRGSVATWIVNMVQKNTPFNTLMALRRQVARPDVVALPEIINALAWTP